jgi:cytochrome c5
MSKRNLNVHSRVLKVACALAAVVLAGGISLDWRIAAMSAARQDLPEGKGAGLARDKCVLCHEADVIVAQRLSRQGWTREVEKMMRWGAKATDAEKEILIDYFSAHFGPRKMAALVATTNVERGKQIFDNQCLLCHEADVISAQRLAKQGWTREVEKMVRWGASVSDAEKDPLVEDLLQTYGPRPPDAKK